MDINFLSNQKKEKRPKRKSAQEQIAWSRPESSVQSEPENIQPRSAGILNRFASIFNKKSDSTPVFVEKAPKKSRASNTTVKIGEKNKSGSSVKKQDMFSALKWEKSDIPGTNLIKSEVIAFFNWRQKISLLIILAISVLFLLGSVYFGLLIWENNIENNNQSLRARIDAINDDIKAAEEYVQDILRFQRKLKTAEQLLNQHIYWTNFFKFLEDNTLADVSYKGFSGGIDGQYSLSASSKSFANITEQLTILKKNEYVEKAGAARAQALAKEEISVQFTLDLKVKPEIFVK